MNEWYSAKELLGVAGMPSTTQGINKAARTKAWQSRKRDGQGGGKEYHISSLPQATRVALKLAAHEDAKTSNEHVRDGAVAGAMLRLQNTVEDTLDNTKREQGLADASMLKGNARSRMDARIQVLQRFDAWLERYDGAPSVARYVFAEAFNAGKIDLEAWVTGHLRGGKISAASLSRWQKQLKKQGLSSLSGGYGNRKGTGLLDSHAGQRDFITAMICEYPHASATHFHRALHARFGDEAVDISERSLQRWVKNWKHDNPRLLLRMTNPDAWKNQFMFAAGSYSDDVMRLNQRWELDSTPADVMLVDGRYSIIGMIDVYSRRPLLHVARTSSADGIVAMLRRAILTYGVPESVKIDNGKDYISKRCLGVFTALNIEEKRSDAFSGWQKPHVERFFKSFNHDICELLPNYKGHNVADAQAIRARQSFSDQLFKKNDVAEIDMTSEQLQTLCDDWVNGVYMIRKHRSLGATPLQKATEYKGHISRVSNERALDMLLAEVPSNHGQRSVTKKGISIKWLGEPRQHWYHSPCLADVQDREKVLVRFDPMGDMGRVFVFYRESFLGTAECPELLGLDKGMHAREVRHTQTKNIAAKKKKLDQIKKEQAVHSVAGEMMEQAAVAAKKVTSMPHTAIEHQTSSLDAAVAAIEAQEAAKAAPLLPSVSPDIVEKAEAMSRKHEAAKAETPEDRFARYQSVTANEAASDEERTWAKQYISNIEGRMAMKRYLYEQEEEAKS